MSKLIPVLTEKSLENAKSGEYTFWVDKGLTKYAIKKLVGSTFGVTVKNVRTITRQGTVKRNYLGKKRVTQPKKKAIVSLAEKQKIDLFETD